MFLSICGHAILYICLIALIHYLYLFFRNNLTTPKIIDLVDKPKKVYQDMYNTIDREDDTIKEGADMKKELKDYFKGLNKKETSETEIPDTTTSLQSSIPEFELQGGSSSMSFSTF